MDELLQHAPTYDKLHGVFITKSAYILASTSSSSLYLMRELATMKGGVRLSDNILSYHAHRSLYTESLPSL